MSFFDRLQEVVPHTGRAWLEAVGIVVVLAVLIFVVLPRLVKPRVLRWAIAVGLLFVAAWLTVLLWCRRFSTPIAAATQSRA